MFPNLDTHTSIAEAFYAIARSMPDKIVYRQAIIGAPQDDHRVPRQRRAVTFREVHSRVARLRSYLQHLGLKPRSRVAIVSNTRPDWMEADLAILAAGGVVVSVYPSLTAHEIGYLLYDSEAHVIFAENQEQVDKLIGLLSQACPIPATEEHGHLSVHLQFSKIITFEQTAPHTLVIPIDQAIADGSTDSTDEYSSATREDLASLVYTSGTTGPPKGVKQTHGNHLANVRQAFQAGIYREHTRLALFLPLAHSFAKLMGYIGFLTPAELEFPAVVNHRSSKPDQESIARDLCEGNAEVFPVVPRLLEKMHEGIIKRAHSHGAQSVVLRVAVWAAERVYRARGDERIPPVHAALAWLLTASVRNRVKQRLFGRSFQYAISGGAKLQRTTNEFFDALGIEVLEGYGLTETCVATNVNRSGANRIGTVGPVLTPDIELRIDDDGEICFRGPNVTNGYLNRPTATRQAWDEQGWFLTGDLGSLDSDGFLRIVGRKKELIVTAGGKKIAPEPIENQVKESPLISQVMLYGDERPYCVMLVVLDEYALQKVERDQSIVFTKPFAEDPRVGELVRAEIERVNRTLASYESIKKFRILSQEFTQENGLLTPTLKVKRKVVAERFRAELEGLYR